MRMRSAPDEPESFEQAPPLDLGEPNDDGPVQELDQPIEIDEPTPDDGDDEPALDLDIGIQLSDAEESDRLSGTELVLDIGELLERRETEETEEEDAGTTGPEHFDLASGLSKLPVEPADSSAAEGTDEPLDDLVSEQLPELDADDQGLADSELDGDLFSLDADRDEREPPPRATEPWTLLQRTRNTHVSDLSAENGTLIAAGDTLLIEPDRKSEQPPGVPAELTSFARVGEELREIFCATRDGRLVRADLDAPGVQGWRELRAPGDGSSFDLFAAGGDVVLAHSALGRLFRSRDRGKTWQPVDVRSRVLTLARHALPLLALAQGRAGPCLLRSGDAGQSWQQLPLDEAARAVALGQSPLLAEDGGVIALADALRGTVVSNDGGASFSQVPKAFGVTALAVGSRVSRRSAWAATHDEFRGLTRILQIDPKTATAVTIAEVEEDESEDSEVFRVEALAWDAAADRLWAGGRFGLAAFAAKLGSESK